MIVAESSDYRAWSPGWHEEAWKRAAGPWDLVVIGGGITGAAIFSAAAHLGLRAILIEQGDFASGTSSRSSKLVHGGLRYLKQGRLRLTVESVRERQRLIGAAPGLIESLPFLYTLYRRDRLPPWVMQAGLFVYTHLAAATGGFQRLSRRQLEALDPAPSLDGLLAAFRYRDASTDDARLVLRVLGSGLAAGAGRVVALSYARAVDLVEASGRVRAAVVRNLVTGEEAEVPGRVVINAGGVWADRLRTHVGGERMLRPLRGSHLFFAFDRLPLTEAVAFMHPADRRPIFAYPWQGVCLVGTTDVDHGAPLDREPGISEDEAEYLLTGVQAIFPDRELGRSDVISTQAGVRPVLSSGLSVPSDESREHVVLSERGLLTVTGGKLTTFRPVALHALRAAHEIDSALPAPPRRTPVLDAGAPGDLDGDGRWIHRYGCQPRRFADWDEEAERPIPGTPYLWGELLWSIRNEAPIHLGDLLLRRFRLGILLGDGAAELLPRLRQPMSAALGWDRGRWERESSRFLEELRSAHGPPAAWSAPAP